MELRKAFAKYDSNIQLSPYQCQAIAGAIVTRRPNCKLLVFGVGNDTGLWLDLNEDGETLFMETSEQWVEIVKGRIPGLNYEIMPTFDRTVENSLGVTLEQLLKYEIPDCLKKDWDVILVDAPPGYKPTDPGRAVAIYWASRLAKPSTHIFVDDYERPLEESFANRLIRDVRPNSSVVVQANRPTAHRRLFWSIGSPLDL